MSKYSAKHDPILKAGEKLIGRALKSLPNQQTLTPDQVHELRVCTKKVRALIQLYRPFSGKTSIKQVEQKIKRLADAYAGSRDAHVLHETLHEMAQTYSSGQDQDIVPLLQYYEQRNKKRQSAQPDIDPLQSLQTIQESWKKKIRPKHQPNFEQGMEYSYHKARKLAFDAESLDEDELYHQCRKWVKYYLYQMQMSVYKTKPDAKPHIKSVKALAELLGNFHDRCVLETALNKLLQKRHGSSESLESAALLMLSWLMEQKRTDKEQCHVYFEQLFSHSQVPILHNPLAS